MRRPNDAGARMYAGTKVSSDESAPATLRSRDDEAVATPRISELALTLLLYASGRDAAKVP